jgi:hypothetical protein
MIASQGGQQRRLGGDVLQSLEEIKALTANLPKIRELLATKSSGSSFVVTVLRAGRVLDITGKAPLRALRGMKRTGPSGPGNS